MKKSLLFICNLLMWMCVTTSAADMNPARAGETEISAQDWCKNVVMGWNLGNALESGGGETGWGNPKTTKAMIHAVREAGFNAIRIPVRWEENLKDQTAMTVNDSWLARVKEVVDWALEEDMYVIINVHHESWLEVDPSNSNKTERNAKLAALWKVIGDYFRNYSYNLAFAGTNEVRRNDWGAPTAEEQEVQNSFNQTFVKAVRSTGGKNKNRNLVVQTFACSPYHGLNGFTIPDDSSTGHLCVEYHYYDPYGYGLLTGNASSDYYYWGTAYEDEAKAAGKRIPSDNESTQSNLFNRIQKAWGDKGLGIVMGEYGVTNHYTEDDKTTQQENMQYYLKTTVANARKRGFAAFVWDNNVFGNGNEKFGIFKRNAGMAVGNTYFLKGICQGAGVDYKEPDSGGGETTEGGETFWEGDAMMDWGDGLQLTVPGEEFSKYGKDVRLLLTYTLDFTDYNMIQFFYGDWSANPSFIIDGNTYEKEYVPGDVHGVSNGDVCSSNVSFSESVYNVLQQKGLAIQGHGIRLNKVVLAKATGIQAVSCDATCADGQFFDLMGRRTASPRKGIYITNGKTVVLK